MGVYKGFEEARSGGVSVTGRYLWSLPKALDLDLLSLLPSPHPKAQQGGPCPGQLMFLPGSPVLGEVSAAHLSKTCRT